MSPQSCKRGGEAGFSPIELDVGGAGDLRFIAAIGAPVLMHAFLYWRAVASQISEESTGAQSEYRIGNDRYAAAGTEYISGRRTWSDGQSLVVSSNGYTIR